MEPRFPRARAPRGVPRRGSMKKPYETPRILHTEKLEARAVSCTKADESS